MRILPFTTNQNQTPDLEEILSRLPLDDMHLSQLSLQPKGDEEAAKYADNVFETQFGDDIQRALGAADAQKLEISRFEDDLKGAQDHMGNLERKLEISEEEKAKSPMTVATMAIQIFLAVMIVFLLCLGAHNFAVLLIKTGEPFLTKPWMAYVTALTAATLFAVVMKSFVSLPKHDNSQRFLATISLGLGVLCGLCYLAILSHIVPPDFTESDVASLIPTLGAPTSPEAVVIDDGGFFGKSARGWLLFFQFVAEAAGATGLSYYFSRNLKAHRAACRRNNPDYLKAEEAVEAAAKRLNEAKGDLAGTHGFLRVMGDARELIIGKAKARVIALQQVIRMVFKVTSMNPH
ncbi:MAG: hypothetical protein WCK77_20535 [Verrucomicrobiota bacterium]